MVGALRFKGVELHLNSLFIYSNFFLGISFRVKTVGPGEMPHLTISYLCLNHSILSCGTFREHKTLMREAINGYHLHLCVYCWFIENRYEGQLFFFFVRHLFNGKQQVCIPSTCVTILGTMDNIKIITNGKRCMYKQCRPRSDCS